MISRRSASGGAGRLPLSVRLGSAFAAVFLVVVAVLVVVAYWGVGRMLRQDLDRALVDVVAQVDASGSAMTTSADRKLGGVESSEVETQLLDRAGRIVGASDDDLRRVPLLDRAQLADVLDQDVLFTDASDGDDPYRVLARPLPGDTGEVQVFAMDGDTVVDAQAALVSLAGRLAACAALLAGLTGWVVARRGLRPLTELTSQADALDPADPSRRLELSHSQNEVARLGRTLNGLLDRIEDARRRERQFTADASHELRTPLAILRAEVELLRDRTAEDSSLRAPLDSALEECDRLTDLVADLLEVARADAGQMDRSRLVDVAAIVDALLPRFSEQRTADRYNAWQQGSTSLRLVKDPVHAQSVFHQVFDVVGTIDGHDVSARAGVFGPTLFKTFVDLGHGVRGLAVDNIGAEQSWTLLSFVDGKLVRLPISGGLHGLHPGTQVVPYRGKGQVGVTWIGPDGQVFTSLQTGGPGQDELFEWQVTDDSGTELTAVDLGRVCMNDYWGTYGTCAR